jgi:D-alanyl-lipoteichoic acid acyltransferase DltB (MBOAT superfamily)
VLGYFKYANSSPTISHNSSAGIVDRVAHGGLAARHFLIAFQKIAYLVDVYQKKIKPGVDFRFSVFASFFRSSLRTDRALPRNRAAASA